MKIKSKEIKDCENPDGTRTSVLDLQYTYKWETWRVLIKDYDDKFYSKILKQLRQEVRNYYILNIEKWQ